MAQREEIRPATGKAYVRAWDLPTRLFHWALVLLMIGAYVTRMYMTDLTWHIWNGYAILVLIVFRVLWGFVGSSTARFSSFVYWPWTCVRYGLDFLLRRPRQFLGHNPLGSLAVLAMLGLIGLQGVLGLMSYDDHDSLGGRSAGLARQRGDDGGGDGVAPAHLLLHPRAHRCAHRRQPALHRLEGREFWLRP